MSDTTLPIHPVTGLQALGFTSRGPIWPVLGGSGEGDSGDGGSGDGNTGGSETDAGAGADRDQGGAETADHWKSKARHWERQSKANALAADELAKIKDSQKSETQKAADAKANAEAEIARIPAKVAESLRDHLVKLHKISDEDAELFLTASDPELLVKQVNRLVGGSDKSKKNHVAREGRNPKAAEGDMAEFTRQVFGGRD